MVVVGGWEVCESVYVIVGGVSEDGGSGRGEGRTRGKRLPLGN